MRRLVDDLGKVPLVWLQLQLERLLIFVHVLAVGEGAVNQLMLVERRIEVVADMLHHFGILIDQLLLLGELGHGLFLFAQLCLPLVNPILQIRILHMSSLHTQPSIIFL